jgi:hypothetical protein
MVLLVRGPAVRGRGSPLTGSGVPAVALSIILSQIGEVRLEGGVIRSQPVLSPSSAGFSRPYDISYRRVKLPRVSAALGGSELRRGADLPQVGRPPPDPLTRDVAGPSLFPWDRRLRFCYVRRCRETP